MKQYTLKEAEDIILLQAEYSISYRALRYYVPHYPSDVTRDGRSLFVSEEFVRKVILNLKNKENKVSDPRSKAELIEELNEIEELKKKLFSEAEELKKKPEVSLPDTEEGIYEQISDLINKLKDLGNTDTIERFTEDEYEQFKDRLAEHRHLTDKVKTLEVHFEEVKASKDEVIAHYKNQFEYQRQLADKQLNQMDMLLEYLKERNTREGERARIEAVEKKVIPREGGRFNNDPYGSMER
jgi:uncharacterized coiled-coil protein SlyX